MYFVSFKLLLKPRQDDPAWYWLNRLSSSPSHL